MTQQIYLLGSAPNSECITTLTPKAQALFYYLIMHPLPQQRAKLIELLWENCPSEQAARNNLSVTLTQLRKHHSPHLHITHQTIGFNHQSDYWLDVNAFQQALHNQPRTLCQLQYAIQLYQADFLDGFNIKQAPEFNTWVQGQRRDLHERMVQTLHTLILKYQQHRDYPAAIEYAQKLLKLDKWQEDTCQTLMLLYKEIGQNHKAIQLYQQLQKRLARYNRKPLTETMNLYRAILHSRQSPHATVQIEELEFPPPKASSTQPPQWISRQITLLYCHWRSTPTLSYPKVALSTWREQREHSQRACLEQVARSHGQVVQQSCNGIWVVFGGDAQTLMDSGQWAVQTALALRDLNASHAHAHAMAMGIHTEHALVAYATDTTIGQIMTPAVEIAETLAHAASARTVLISGATYAWVQGFFACTALPLQNHQPDTSAYQVDGLTAANNRVEAALCAQAPLTPLVGQQDLLQTLAQAWEAVLNGREKMVLIQGSNGIGKSRLLHEFKTELTQQPEHLVWQCQCRPYAQSVPLHPLRRLLHNWLQTKNTAQQAAIQQLVEAIQAYTTHYPVNPLREIVSALCETEATTQVNYYEVVTHLVNVLTNIASERPTLLIIEDLQYADSVMLQFIHTLLDRHALHPSGQLLLVLTAASNFSCAWLNDAPLTTLRVPRLTDAEAETLLHHLASDATLTATTQQQILQLAEGVPLFIEALVGSLLNPAEPPVVQQMPAALHDLLALQIAQLSAAGRSVARVAVGCERYFSYVDIKAHWQTDEMALQQGLDNLVQHRLLSASGEMPEVCYQFNGQLLREWLRVTHEDMAE